jgi:hypothetical protein
MLPFFFRSLTIFYSLPDPHNTHYSCIVSLKYLGLPDPVSSSVKVLEFDGWCSHDSGYDGFCKLVREKSGEYAEGILLFLQPLTTFLGLGLFTVGLVAAIFS